MRRPLTPIWRACITRIATTLDPLYPPRRIRARCPSRRATLAWRILSDLGRLTLLHLGFAPLAIFTVNNSGLLW